MYSGLDCISTPASESGCGDKVGVVEKEWLRICTNTFNGDTAPVNCSPTERKRVTGANEVEKSLCNDSTAPITGRFWHCLVVSYQRRRGKKPYIIIN